MPAPIYDLNRYDLSTLRAFAELHNLFSGRQPKKADLLTALSQHFERPEVIRQTLTRLNPLERKVLDLLLLAPADGLTLPALFRLAQMLGIAPMPSTTNLEAVRPTLRTLNAASANIIQTPLRLCALGLAVGWRGRTRDLPSYQTVVSWDRFDAIGLPEHVRSALPLPAWAPKLLPEAEIKHTASGSARSFQRSLYFYWSQVHRQPLQIKQDGFLYKRDLKAINAVLMQPIANLQGEPEHPDLLFFRLMAQSLRLLQLAPGDMITAPGSPSFFDDTPENRIRLCFDAWLKANWWDESTAISQFSQNSTFGTDLRQLLVAHLQQAPVDQWIDRASLVDALSPMLLGAIYSEISAYTYYGRDSLSSLITNAARLSVYGDPLDRYLEASLEGPLHWMGLVDIGFGAKQNPTAFRLTPAGALALGRIAQLDLPAAAGQVIVQPNYHILAIDPVPDATLASLDAFAERQKAGRVTEYELTRASVHQGALGAWPVRRVIDFLQQSTGAALPGNVLRTLQEWEEGHNRIRFFSPLAVLETATAAETTALHRLPPVAATLGQTLTPTLSLVRDLSALQAAMRAADLLLEHSSAQSSGGRPAFRLSDEGRLHPITPVIGLGASAPVAAFTENTDAGLILSPRALQAAVKSGLKIEAILDALKKALVHPLSPEWERRLKTWTAHFGNARTTPRALLELRSAEVLAELRNDPQITRLLKPFQPRHALATFDPADRQRLQELLAHYGIEMTDDLV